MSASCCWVSAHARRYPRKIAQSNGRPTPPSAEYRALHSRILMRRSAFRQRQQRPSIRLAARIRARPCRLGAGRSSTGREAATAQIIQFGADEEDPRCTALSLEFGVHRRAGAPARFARLFSDAAAASQTSGTASAGPMKYWPLGGVDGEVIGHVLAGRDAVRIGVRAPAAADAGRRGSEFPGRLSERVHSVSAASGLLACRSGDGCTLTSSRPRLRPRSRMP